MPTVRKTLSVTGHQDAWIAIHAAGRFTNYRELIPDPIRREQERSGGNERLRQALIAGSLGGLTSTSSNTVLNERLDTTTTQRKESTV